MGSTMRIKAAHQCLIKLCPPLFMAIECRRCFLLFCDN